MGRATSLWSSLECPCGWCPREDSNLRTRLRRAALYPLSYGGQSQKILGDRGASLPHGHYRSDMPNVLVVDDTGSIRLLIRTNLELAGYDVEESVDGEACLEYLAGLDDLPDAITMDVMMPRLDGISTVARIRRDRRYDDVAVVMVTTQNHPNDLARAKEAGVDEYVLKPFDPDELVETVARAIAARSQR